MATAARERLAMPIRDYGGFDEAEELEDARALVPALADAVDGLPSGERAALQLRVVDELPYDEVAKRLAITVPAARMRVSRALGSLHAKLRGVEP